jgi:DNA-binding CsgD family transcriptional regulator
VGLAGAAAAADGLAGIGVFQPGTPLRFVHPIVRTAAYEDIPRAGRGLRHAEAARLLAAEGADLDVVCAHLMMCEPTGSAEVVERLRAAATRAVGRGAPESAADYLRRAMAETADVSLRAQLAQELGRAEKVLGDPAADEHLRESLREVRGRLALAADDLSTARAELRAAAGTYETLHLLNPSGSCWRSALSLALATEDPVEARRLADSELEDAQRAGLPRPTGIALRTRGLLEGGERGLSDLRAAAELAAASGARLERARSLVELGAALRRGNQRNAAREPLRTGLHLAYQCGATRLAQRARTELLAAGARPRRGALTGLEALTASERRVAELAAAGLSNPEIAQSLFVTLNTVEGHLRHVYRKLSIGSRGQLPAALRSAAPETARPDGPHKTTVAP